MGTWDVHSFGNDTAADWAWGLDNSNDFSLVEETLDKVLAAGSDYLDAPTAEEGIAAAESVARAQGSVGISDAYSESVDNWVARLTQKPSPSIAKKARDAIDRVLTAPSELMELWEETEEKARWVQSVDELKARIQI